MDVVTFYTFDEIKDKHIGKVGTAHRDRYEAELQSFLADKAIPSHCKNSLVTR